MTDLIKNRNVDNFDKQDMQVIAMMAGVSLVTVRSYLDGYGVKARTAAAIDDAARHYRLMRKAYPETRYPMPWKKRDSSSEISDGLWDKLERFVHSHASEFARYWSREVTNLLAMELHRVVALHALIVKCDLPVDRSQSREIAERALWIAEDMRLACVQWELAEDAAERAEDARRWDSAEEARVQEESRPRKGAA